MKNQTVQQALTMKDGLSSNILGTKEETISQIFDEFTETLTDFERKIDRARINGDEWVETSKEIVKHLNPRGLGGAKYFIFKNIKVAEKGTVDDLINEETAQETRFVPGESKATFDGTI